MVGLYLRTARYYRPGQIAARLHLGLDSVIRRRLPGLARRRYEVPSGLRRDTNAVFFDSRCAGRDCDLTRQQENAARLQCGIFRFLNKEERLGSPVNWDPAETTRLWRYNLHYFDYAIDLAIIARWANDAESAALLGRLFAEWIEANPVGEGVPWHSYPIARRIVNWVEAVSLASPEAVFRGSEDESAWLASLYRQARYLEDHLEVDLLGNHLLTNGKALVFAGLFFGGETGSRWFNIGQEILWRGLADQIHPDGGHEERSPMYQAIVLQDYLEVVLACRLNQRTIPDFVRERLIAMADFVDGIRHPDGEIPLFGDSAFGIAHSPADLLAAAERLLNVPGRWRDEKPGIYCALLAPEVREKEQSAPPFQPRSEWRETGYVKLSGATAADAMLIDTKPPGPPHLPAHGHCSLFSYELSINGRRAVVDSGVEEYEPGEWRTYWRSTRAHNTVSVDGAEQNEIWGAFRAGQRARMLESVRIEQAGVSLFMGSHAGFVRQRTPTPHRRILAALPDGVWIVADEVSGEGRHTVESFVHYAPDASCQIDGASAYLHLEGAPLRFYPLIGPHGDCTKMTTVRGSTNPIQGFYAEEFGKREPATVLIFSCNAELPARLGYLIAPADFPVTSWNIERLVRDQGPQIKIEIRTAQGDKEYRINLPH